MSINRKELEEIATLAQLDIPEQQLGEITASLNQVMAMIEHINEADTAAVKPMGTPHEAQQLIRPDAVTDCSHKKDLLALSAHADEDHYLVPKVIE
ncbi:Asp-tRNA(Asn)/Glu-tRNA(Gln) amidotransferase subunit GatC [Marinicella sp. S1101]|uniref:Asp-tRNA(Asn)/Glu-tRNA(Gln) amidotransferase subunit GatC n=1 Tax=Marinicella marina TaxID=2996016 RepID=UPI002260FA5F|nr:Asp-tRNA(Asn)/Glu-tRNA(Gln) amidotransferase subunit GatC [Marinicella marina]MCX7552528.1 Asp-tRNA(Asn)/Glu-tRNA(Gln) amidotransferase subunit GatC [Marinicella marina]MDJ1139404.1 Asp-tRNA(Asn)/Glu-tRNA(Gln) amidotransferase subunit GatC [Marinicella marina]